MYGRQVFGQRLCLASRFGAGGLRAALLDTIDDAETLDVRPIVLYRHTKTEASRPPFDPGSERRTGVFSPPIPANNERTHRSTADDVPLRKYSATACRIAVGEENVPLGPCRQPTFGDVKQNSTANGWELLVIFPGAAAARDESLQLLR